MIGTGFSGPLASEIYLDHTVNANSHCDSGLYIMGSQQESNTGSHASTIRKQDRLKLSYSIWIGAWSQSKRLVIASSISDFFC